MGSGMSSESLLSSMARKPHHKRAASWAAPQTASSAYEPKPTYVLQKEEREKLLDEASVLEEQLEALRLRAGLPSRQEREAIAERKAQSFELQERIATITLQLNRAHSLVTRKMLSPPVPPLATYIHLPRDMDERCAILRSLKHMKLQRAERFIHEHFYYIDPCMEYLKEERYTGDDGLFHCDRYEINQFPNFKSAQQLYDALLNYMSNMEIAVTEMIGQLTLREDTSDIEPTIWNYRIVTTAEDVGCVEELNIVGFAQFYETHGVIASEAVDEDDLYPYRPLERTHKDSQVMHVACEAVDPVTRQKVVLLKSCTMATELKVGLQLPRRVERKLHEHASRWSRLMVEYLHEYKVTEGPRPAEDS